MIEVVPYILVVMYIVICDIGISSWVKKSIGQPIHESRKNWHKLYRTSILFTTAIIVFIGVGVYLRMVVIN